jgi:hypothetical protein
MRPQPIKLPLPKEVILRINKYMSSPTSFLVKHVPVSTRDWSDYDRCLHLHKQYKIYCYLHHITPMEFMSTWTSSDYELFLYVYPYMKIENVSFFGF